MSVKLTKRAAWELISRIHPRLNIKKEPTPPDVAIFTATTGPEGLEIRCENDWFNRNGRIKLTICNVDGGTPIIRYYHPDTLNRDYVAEQAEKEDEAKQARQPARREEMLKRPPADVKPVLKYAGAKWRIADWISGFFPPHEIYLEPFFGSGAVFFRKAPARLETINDIDGNVVNLFRVLREQPEQLAALIELTPWARDEYYSSYEKTGEPVEDARRFLVRCWQAFGTMTAARTGWRHSATGRSPVMPQQWNRLPDKLEAAATRLKDAQIENMDAVQLIKKYNDPRCLIYADPPYTPETRRKNIYAQEMTTEQHIQLLEALRAHSGSVVLSGYANEIYDNMLHDWKRIEKRALAERGQTRTEILWVKNAKGGEEPC